MTPVTGNPATLRRRLLAVLTATGIGGTVAAMLISAPGATGAPDPCAASETARTISNVARSAGDYLDGHPETNQAMTFALLQPAGAQSADSLRTYLTANPKAASDLQTIALPLAGLATRCQTPQISLPQVLGFPQFALSSPSVAPANPATTPANPPATGPAARTGYGPSASTAPPATSTPPAAGVVR